MITKLSALIVSLLHAIVPAFDVIDCYRFYKELKIFPMNLRNFILIIFLSLVGHGFSEQNLVEELNELKLRKFKVSATGVSGVNVLFKADVTRKDCNKIEIDLLNGKPTRVSGKKKINYFKSLYVEAILKSNQVFCPLPEPVEETVQTKEFYYESLSNDSADGVVDLTFSVPEWMYVEAEAVEIEK